jgi:pimeloyl-ACP methyl ester carboxylesterase
MTPAARAARAALVGLSAVAPPLAAEVGYRIWRSVGRAETVHPRDAHVHARAERGILDLDGTPVVTYTWGDGPEVVLLVHGWRSRASRYAPLVDALEAPGRTIVAFDAPGHGDTPGDRTSVLEFARILRLLAARHGGVSAIVGHSIGVLGAFLAVREGVAVDRLVGIAGIHDADEIVDQFSRESGLGARATRGLRSRIEQRFFAGVPDVWGRFTAELDPTDTATEVLLVHDLDDPRVGFGQSEQIRDAHTGPVRLVATEGLGHNRILGSSAVVDEVAAFLDGPRVADRPYRTGSRPL